MRFYLKPSNSDTYLIMGIIYHQQFEKGYFKYSTKERIDPKAWKNGMPVSGYESLTSRLLEIKRAANDYILLNRRSLSRENLRLHLDNLSPKEQAKSQKLSLLEEWREYLNLIDIEDSTRAAYASSPDTFEEFLRAKKMSVALRPEDLTLKHIRMYVKWLREEARDTRKVKKNKGEPEPLKPNTIAKKIKHLKMALTEMTKHNIKIGVDLKDIKYFQTPGLKLHVPEEDLEKLKTYDFRDIHAVVRDIFVVQCHTGMRISDLFRINQNLRDGKIRIETQKVKGNWVEIPLLPVVKQILEKYNYQLPVVSEQDYRRGIKYIYRKVAPNRKIQVRTSTGFKEVYVWEELSSHDAIRTFVNMSLDRGMKVTSIAKIVGKSLKTLISHYVVESQEEAEEDMIEAWDM